MNCSQVLDRLSPFVDDELDPATSAELVAHFATCESCAAALAALRALRERVRAEAEYHRAPDLLRARLRRAVRDAAPEPAPARAPRLRLFAAAAGIAVVAAGVWFTGVARWESGTERLAGEVVTDHVRSLLASHLTDVTSTDQHTVKPWFAGKLDFSPPVADFAAQGFPLLGGRLDVVDGRTVAALVYRHRLHVINVFVWPSANGADASAPTLARRGFHLVHGAHAGMTWWMVSDLNGEELAAFGRTFAGGAPAP